MSNSPLVQWLEYRMIDGVVGPVVLSPAEYIVGYQPRAGWAVRLLRGGEQAARARWCRVTVGDPDGPLVPDTDRIAAREQIARGSTGMVSVEDG
jgi:hypothetical protein